MTNNQTQVPGLSFSNPTEIDDSDLLESFGLSFGSAEDKINDDSENHNKPKTPKLNIGVKEKEETKELEKEEEEEQELKINVPGLSVNNENQEIEEQTEESNLISAVNILADKFKEEGSDFEVYEGFDENAELTPEIFTKLVNHNFNKKLDESFDSFFGGLSENTQRVIQFDINSKGKDVDGFLRTLVETQSIKSLDVENEYDQEKILRQWFKSKEDLNNTEIEERIKDLKEASLLEKEAKRIKPKLDNEAEKIAKQKETEQQNIRQIEQQVSSEYNNKLVKTLEKGEVGGIKLTKEELSTVYSFMSNDEMKLKTHKGEVSMNPLEAIIFYHKYDPKGSVERLALATLQLTNPEKFDEYYLKKAETKLTKEFTKDHKFSNSVKIGGNSQDSSPEGSRKKKGESNKYPWILKM